MPPRRPPKESVAADIALEYRQEALPLSALDQAVGLLKEKAGSVVASDEISVGVANKSYVLRTDTGATLVLRQLRVQTPESARTEARIQRLLRDSGIETPVYQPFEDGDVVARIAGHSMTISPFLEGEIPAERTLELARSFGATLARIHDALHTMTRADVPDNTAQWLSRKNVQAEITKCHDRDFAAILTSHSRRLGHVPDLDLPRSTIHGDLYLPNVFARAG